MKLLDVASITFDKLWKGETGQALHDLSADLIDEAKKMFAFNAWFDVNRDILFDIASEVKDNEQTS